MAAEATRGSWKTRPCPERREHFDLPLLFTGAEAERIRMGHVPVDMDDKWFLFFEEGWLYFHRSWTGDCIYALRLDGSPAGVRVVDCWASRDGERYRSPGVEKEREIVWGVIAVKLLA